MYGAPDATGRSELLYVGKARSLRDRVGNYFLASNVDPEGAGAGAAHRAHRGHGHQLRDRGAAARIQPHQGAQAALQHRAARRQELSLHLSTRRATIPAAGVLPRRAQPARALLRAVSRAPARCKETLQQHAEALPHPQLPRHLLRQPQPALPAAPDRPLLGALREAHRARGLRAATSQRPSRCSKAATTRSSAELHGAHGGGGRAACSTSAPRALRDQLAALKQIQAQQIVTAEGDRDIDVFALVGEPGEFAVSVMIVRGGRNLGTTSYFPKGCAGRARTRRWPPSSCSTTPSTPPPPEILVNLRTGRGRGA